MSHQKYWKAAALLGAAVSTLTLPAQAGQVATVGQPEQVVITGYLEENLPRDLAQMGTRVDTVSAVTIQNGGYTDVAQSLQVTVPGLHIAPLSGPFDYVDMSLLGSRTQDVLWTVDGVRINNRLYGGTTPLDTLPASMIERIEVLDGAQALFYGTQAIGGAINIVTKDFSDRPDGHVSVGVDTNGGRRTDGYFRDKIGGGSFVVYGSADKSDGFQPFRDQDYQPSSTDHHRTYEVLTIGGKYARDLGNDIRFVISEQHTDAKLDFARPVFFRQAYNERNEDVLSAKIDYAPSETMQFFIKGYYHWWYTYYTEYDNDTDPVTGALTGSVSVIDDHDFWGFTDYGVNAMGKFSPTPAFDVYAGYDYQNYEGSDVVYNISKKTEHVHAFFGEIATTSAFLGNAQLAAGFRYNAPSVGESSTVYNLTGRWNLTDALYVKGMVGTAFRLPTAEELFVDVPGDELGNPDLKPEKSFEVNGSVGGEIGLPGVHWEVVGFYRKIKDLIQLTGFEPITSSSVWENTPNEVETKGGMFVVNADLNSEFGANLSYTFSQTENTTTGAQITRVPKQLGKVLLDYHPMGLPFGLFGSMNYVGTEYETLGGVRTKYGDYAVFDIGARYFVDPDRHHRIDVTVANLFDKEYAARLRRDFPDDPNGSPYIVPFLGLPRTLRVSYSYAFF